MMEDMGTEGGMGSEIDSAGETGEIVYAIPEKQMYPIGTRDEARASLDEVSMNGTPEEKDIVWAAVSERFPDLIATPSKPTGMLDYEGGGDMGGGSMGRMAAMAMLVICLVSAVCFAGASVYQRSIQALTPAGGAATWTNNMDVVRNGAIVLKKLWVIGDSAAADTVTVTRVGFETSHTNAAYDGYTNAVTVTTWYTQAVCTVGVAANAGSTNIFTEPYLTYGDTLVFSAASSTGSTVMIEYEVQKY